MAAASFVQEMRSMGKLGLSHSPRRPWLFLASGKAETVVLARGLARCPPDRGEADVPGGKPRDRPNPRQAAPVMGWCWKQGPEAARNPNQGWKERGCGQRRRQDREVRAPWPARGQPTPPTRLFGQRSRTPPEGFPFKSGVCAPLRPRPGFPCSLLLSPPPSYRAATAAERLLLLPR
ncbi:hypothetical protein GH733_011654 [Mirounga leonina]|nr:hypothetical protein GH733_011654 [Mirounga leonina]